MNTFKPARLAARKQGGIALLEALIATVILAIGLLGAIGMQARAYAALNEAGLRAEATIASEKLLAQMAIDQANVTSYAYAGGAGSAQVAPWVAETTGRIPNAGLKVVVTPVSATRSQVDISISWQRKAGAGSPVNVHNITSYIASSK
ncbi:MAG: prepilin-type N-terminal cleavage/methylation domain-containing protein [Massilia sp.]